MSLEEPGNQQYYMILFVKNDRGLAKFYAGSRPPMGVLEAEIICDHRLVEHAARRNGFTKIGRGQYRKTFVTSEWEGYARTMIIAALTAKLRSERKKMMCIDKLEELSYLDLKYWAGTIIQYYKEKGKNGIYRPAKALRILLGIDRK